jgi:putative membrane protein
MAISTSEAPSKDVWAFATARVTRGTHESTLPLLGLDKPPTQQPLREHTSELATHAFYGFAVEFVRRRLMRRWKVMAS